MSGPPELIQLMIFLMCLTILPTMIQGRLAWEEHKERLLSISENDKCEKILHTQERPIQCEQALNHFLKLRKYFQSHCPNARDAACRVVGPGPKCTFTCDPTDAEIAAAKRVGCNSVPTIKTLDIVTIPSRRHMSESDAERHQRQRRYEEREQQADQRKYKKTLRQRERTLQRRRFMELRQSESQRQRQQPQRPLQQNQSYIVPQQEERQSQFRRAEAARVKRQLRAQIIKEKRNQRQRP